MAYQMTSITSFVDTIARNRLLDPPQMDKLTRQLQHRFADPQLLAQDLVRRGWVTPQQIYPLLQNGAGQPQTYREQKAASRRRWLTFNIVGALVIVVLAGVIWYGLKQDQLRARDHAEAVRLRAVEEQARAELKPLEDAFQNFTMEDEQLRKNLLAFRVRYCEVPAALRAAELLALLPSPLDSLNKGGIPKDDVEKGQPENLVAVLGERRWRHWGAIRAVALQGETVASAGDDAVRIWEKKTGRELTALAVPDAVALSFVSGGKMLACATPDGNVSLWETATGKKYGDYPGPAGNVVTVAFARDRERDDQLLAASVQKDGLVKVWELQTGKERGTLRGHTGAVHCVAFSPDSYTLATGGADGQVRLWTQSGELKATPFAEHTDGVRSVAFSSDGKLLASGGAERDCNVILWDIAKSESIVTMEGHQQPVIGLAFTADQKHIVSASADETMRIWEVKLKEEKKPAAPQPNPNNQNQADNANQNADNANDPKPAPLPMLPPKPVWVKLTGHAGPVLAVTIAGEGEGETIASAGADGTVRLWSVSKRNEITSMGDHRGPVSGVAFVDDGRFLASGSLDKTVKIWNVPAGALRNGYAHAAAVSSVGYSAADKIVASGSVDGTVKLFDAGMNKEVNKDLGTLTGHLGPIMSVAFSLDGKTLAVGAAAGEQSGQVKLWNPATRNERGSLAGHQDVVSALAFTPDGRTLASASYDGSVRFTEPYLGLPRGVIQAKGDRVAIVALAVAPDGKSAAGAGYNRVVHVWDIASHDERKTYAGQSGVCKGLAYSPDGKLLASAQQDGKVIVWNTASDDKKEWQFPGAINGVSFAPDSRHLATANANGTVYVLRVADTPVRRKR
jgi:WD40 repeat protein